MAPDRSAALPGRRGRLRRAASVLLGGAAVFAAAGLPAVGAAPRPGRLDRVHTVGPATPGAVLPAVRGGPLPSAAAVRAALAGPLASPAVSRSVASEVLDLDTGRVLESAGAQLPVTAASAVKLAVATAALSRLGDSARPATVVRAAAAPRDGVVRGNLLLVGGGDVLLAPGGPGPYPATADLDALAAAVAAAGVREVTGGVLGDGALFDGPGTAPGWRANYLTEGDVAPVSALEADGGRLRADLATAARAVDPPLSAAADLVSALRARGVRVLGGAGTTTAPAGTGVLLGRVEGPALSVEVESMLTRSDNDIAESLGRLLALREGLPATFAGAARAVTGELTALGVDTTGLSLVDASGLSRLDRAPLSLLVDLLRRAAQPGAGALRPIVTGLPVAGFSGTLAGRYLGGPSAAAAGRVRAKTGFLDGVVALVGLVVDRDGRELVFGFDSDAARGPAAAETALDDAATALAAL
jgi:D-alanyl-D-alanine carboxypeptidase/D-alanyl-D-alanine-endopeptidase (penicillin-binding protein 4)